MLGKSPPPGHRGPRRRGRRTSSVAAYERRVAHVWATVLQRFRDYVAAGGQPVNPEEPDVQP